jgi:hypothetical protein
MELVKQLLVLAVLFTLVVFVPRMGWLLLVRLFGRTPRRSS